ncbi:lipoprotein [Haloferula helveola]|uniref:Lipoprotein n=1 Tax=Haloferula helveola TaxID=490095 RepID=A0ABN6H567_9BACT|nr:lipoprotein [Haloferula helveola]
MPTIRSTIHSWLLPVVLALVSLAPSLHAAPEEIREAFLSRYGPIESVDWEVDSNGYWEAQFENDGESYRADFDTDGNWIETERNLDFEDLPDPVKTAIRAEHGDREIAEIEEVDSAEKGRFYDVEFQEKGPNQDVQYSQDGEPLGSFIPGISSPLPKIENGQTLADGITLGELALESITNLLTILIYAYLIYYRRHHNHKMMFLLLAFNLFLFPIFLLSSVLTMGFGFTIFALLALVRLRSENFGKAEVAYLLGAVSLTFINSQLSAQVEVFASATVLLTAFLADHPYFWRAAYQTTEIRYRISDTEKMLDRQYLREAISKEFNIIVNEVEIDRVCNKEVRLTVVYSDIEEDTDEKKSGKSKKNGKED